MPSWVLKGAFAHECQRVRPAKQCIAVQGVSSSTPVLDLSTWGNTGRTIAVPDEDVVVQRQRTDVGHRVLLNLRHTQDKHMQVSYCHLLLWQM